MTTLGRNGLKVPGMILARREEDKMSKKKDSWLKAFYLILFIFAMIGLVWGVLWTDKLFRDLKAETQDPKITAFWGMEGLVYGASENNPVYVNFQAQELIYDAKKVAYAPQDNICYGDNQIITQKGAALVHGPSKQDIEKTMGLKGIYRYRIFATFTGDENDAVYGDWVTSIKLSKKIQE